MSPSVAPVRCSGSIARRNARSRAVVTTGGVSPPIFSSLPGNTAAMAYHNVRTLSADDKWTQSGFLSGRVYNAFHSI
jgi:hypothetical protein